MYGESSNLMQFANEAGGDNGLELVPRNPILALEMRAAMDKFDKLRSY